MRVIKATSLFWLNLFYKYLRQVWDIVDDPLGEREGVCYKFVEKGLELLESDDQLQDTMWNTLILRIKLETGITRQVWIEVLFALMRSLKNYQPLQGLLQSQVDLFPDVRYIYRDIGEAHYHLFEQGVDEYQNLLTEKIGEVMTARCENSDARRIFLVEQLLLNADVRDSVDEDAFRSLAWQNQNILPILIKILYSSSFGGSKYHFDSIFNAAAACFHVYLRERPHYIQQGIVDKLQQVMFRQDLISEDYGEAPMELIIWIYGKIMDKLPHLINQKGIDQIYELCYHPRFSSAAFEVFERAMKTLPQFMKEEKVQKLLNFIKKKRIHDKEMERIKEEEYEKNRAKEVERLMEEHRQRKKDR